MCRSAVSVALLASLLATAQALSWPLCADGGSVWVTERPSTGSTYPGANLWYFCDGQLNILGDSVDPCINEGSICTAAVTDAICKFLGYDQAYEGSVLKEAQPGEVVRSLSGEYCLRDGLYSRELPDNLAQLPGQPCRRIEELTCIRTIEHMARDLEDIVWELALNNATASQDMPVFNASLPVRAAGAP